MNTRLIFSGAAGLLAVALFAAPAPAASLDKALLDKGLDVLGKLREEGVGTVGVLPFSVKRGSRGAAFSSAPLATNLSGRLENVLVLRQSATTPEPVRVIRDASAVAAKNKVGSWVTSEASFKRLFSTKYPLIWGKKTYAPDGFLTGNVVADPKTSTLTVNVKLITAKSWKGGKVVPMNVVAIKCKADRDLLRDLGYNFSLPASKFRSRALKRDDLENEARDQIKKEEEGKVKQPDPKNAASHSPDNVGGLKLEIYYGKELQTVTAVGGGGAEAQQPLFEVPTPKEGQEVVLVITRLKAEGGKIGAVLKVNGLSTYAQQDGPVEGCLRWIYRPEKAGKPDPFKGFYTKKDGALVHTPFEVMTEEESKVRASELGGRAGWIDLDVFIEGEAPVGGDKPPVGGDKPPKGKDDDLEGLVISTRGGSRARGASFEEAQKAIARANNIKLTKLPFAARGLIGTRAEAASPEPYTSSDLPNPRHVGGISIRYYTRPPAGGDGDGREIGD